MDRPPLATGSIQHISNGHPSGTRTRKFHRERVVTLANLSMGRYIKLVDRTLHKAFYVPFCPSPNAAKSFLGTTNSN